MATTVQSIRDKLRNMVLDAAPGAVWDDGELNRWISDAQFAVAHNFPGSMEEYGNATLHSDSVFQSLGGTASSDGTDPIADTEMSLPSSHEGIRILGIEANVAARGGGRVRLSNRKDMDHVYPKWPSDKIGTYTSGTGSASRVQVAADETAYRNNQSLTSPSAFQYYMMDDDSLRAFYVWPQPDNTGEMLSLRYVKQPALIGSSTTNIEIADRFEPMLVDWALSRMYLKEGMDPNRSQIHFERFMAQVKSTEAEDVDESPVLDERQPFRNRASDESDG